MMPNAVTLRFSWQGLGKVSLDDGGRPVFPCAPNAPGLYCFQFAANETSAFYVGQTDNLARRFQHYRTPGPSQQTNIRLNRLVAETLRNSGNVSVAIITGGADVGIDHEVRPVEFGARSERLLLEQAAIVVLDDKGAETLNR